MEIITSPQQMQQRSIAARNAGQTVTFVPTMGYLHKGHLSLLKEGRKQGDLLVLSIFVNPVQFGQGEDFEEYPRDLERDSELARSVGVDVIFAPMAVDMYPRDYATYVAVEAMTDTLCGTSRPGHFRGVTTVVTKLFNIVQPHKAFFGAKDFQQLAVIKRMTLDMNMPVEVIGLPIFREDDGLAMSSRNVNLSDEERRQALCLSRSLKQARDLVASGERDGAKVLAEVRRIIEEQPLTSIDYAQICHQLSLEDQDQVDENSVLILAVNFSKARLLDNGFLMVAS